MAQYRITLTVKTDTKAPGAKRGQVSPPRRGARETLRYRVLKMLGTSGVSLGTLRSLKVRRDA